MTVRYLMGIKVTLATVVCLAPLVAQAAPGDVYIEFMARPTAPISQHTPGHVFFCISLQLNVGPKEECFGFYPQDPMKAFDGPGIISNEFKKAAIQNVSVSLTHKIDEDVRKSIYNEIGKWAGADYKLLVNNCKSLVSSIAQIAGLKVPIPSAITLPTDYLQGLKSLYWIGQWSSTDPGSRFVLSITKDNMVSWHERGPETGKEVAKSVALVPTATGSRVSRENSQEVLAELGYQVAIIPQILAAGPRPSFMDLQRVGSKLIGQWNGLVVIKDAKGKFLRIEQPGVRAPKGFDFKLAPGT